MTPNLFSGHLRRGGGKTGQKSVKKKSKNTDSTQLERFLLTRKRFAYTSLITLTMPQNCQGHRLQADDELHDHEAGM